MAESPREPVPETIAWFFHDSPLQLDDPASPLPSSTTNAKHPKEASPAPASKNKATLPDVMASGVYGDPPVFSATSSIVGTITPNTAWSAFNPTDCLALEDEYRKVLESHESQPKKRKSVADDLNGPPKEHFESFPKADICGLVPVGLDRLYEVSLDDYFMRPIYWAPLGHPANVHRSTWFFSSSLTPIEPSFESALEKAFLQIRPWTSTYLHELESAAQVPEALSKFRVPITYQDAKGSVKAEVVFAPSYYADGEPATPQHDQSQSADAAELASRLNVMPPPAGLAPPASPGRQSTPVREHYASYPVAYIFGVSGSISIPLLSSYPSPAALVSALLAGRTPTGTLFKVQRHFTWQDWKKLKTLPDRPTDAVDFEPKKINQLVLVMHGIGQKLTERVESFNFTYAINSFRMQVSHYAADPAVEPYIEPNTGIMTLPINWRRTLDFDKLQGNVDNRGFNLNDITLKSIPTVRNLISDVMLDIPYYMSIHKPLLLQAAAREANRVYSLFLHHNPGFKEDGTVNIIGHSLGSIISVDILSTQPTNVPEQVPNNDRYFNFNVRNLFLVGSPVAFFLLLNDSRLYPRERYDKENPGGEPPYGCIAVRNVYNVMHYSDPIAYYLGPTVDRVQAAKIEPPTLPTEKLFPPPGSDANAGFLNALTSRMPNMPTMPTMPTMPAMPAMPGIPFLERSPAPKADDDSGTDLAIAVAAAEATDAMEVDETAAAPIPAGEAVEMETRDAGLEDVERRLHQLNENGQVDWLVPLVGTLENQYVSMLTAHSSYWDNRDFARMVAVECGRAPGEEATLLQYRAKKDI